MLLAESRKSVDLDHDEPEPMRPTPSSIPSIDTAVRAETLVALNERLLTWPSDFTPHPRLAKQLERRREALGAAGGIDWGHAEALAFAALVAEGVHVRITGQDAERGTFTVPENRSDPNSRRITIGFVRFKSTSASPGDPIVYLAGGPGGTGVGTAHGPRFPIFMALREVSDVIAYDQRGTGLSSPTPLCAAQPLFDMTATPIELEVLSWGVAGGVRDGGRTGLAHVGRSRGGAVDLHSLRLGNRLLGNADHLAALETSGGLAVRTGGTVMMAVTGSPCDVHVSGGPPLGWGAPQVVPAGAVVR